MILLDTHAWLWLAITPKKLSRPAARAIQQATKSAGIAIASITLLESAWLFANGRIRSSGTIAQAVAQLVDRTRVQVLELTSDVAAMQSSYPLRFRRTRPIA